MLNWDRISRRKIPLNFGLLLQNLIYIGNLSTLLQLLILNKAYYLEIKIGLINESHQIFSTRQPFWNHYFSTGRGQTGDPSVSIIPSCITSYPVLSYRIVSSSILSYHITSHQTTTYQTTVIIIGSFGEYNHNPYNLYDWKLSRPQSLLLISKAHKLRIKVIN